jgi:ribosomal protein L18E
VQYDVDIDQMTEMYDRTYPGDDEVDQVQWKNFWTAHQKYHTICLSCLTKSKGVAARDMLRGEGGGDFYDDVPEAYPDWGPVYLSAASKAIMLNWYKQAQQIRAKKRKNAPTRREKVVKAISDDEGEDVPLPWVNKRMQFSEATRAIAVKWNRTARARLQKKAGRGAGLREADRDGPVDSGAVGLGQSGTKSRLGRK